jgi:TolB protein
MRRLLPLLLCAVPAAGVSAQDTTAAGDAIKIVIEFNPGEQPALVVVPGAGLDSVRAIVARDLGFSDRFRMIPMPAAGGTSAHATAEEGSVLNYGLYQAMGADFAVTLGPAPGGVTAQLHDVRGARVRDQLTVMLPPLGEPGFRMEVHRLSDELVRRATGALGIAATRLLYVSGGRIYQVDSDGHGPTPIATAGGSALSPVWSPDGQRIAYTALAEGRGAVMVQTLSSGASFKAPGTEGALNITPAFSPDGRMLAYARSDEGGTDIFTANVADRCCAQRLTVGRFSDNLSPTFSPDGRRIAYVSTRAGPPQVYVMAADGTDQELLAPFDYGATGSSNAPEWSPDGALVAFHRDVAWPQRGPDVGPRRPAPRVRLGPDRPPPALGDRRRDRHYPADHHRRGDPAPVLVPQDRSDRDRPVPLNRVEPANRSDDARDPSADAPRRRGARRVRRQVGAGAAGPRAGAGAHRSAGAGPSSDRDGRRGGPRARGARAAGARGA